MYPGTRKSLPSTVSQSNGLRKRRRKREFRAQRRMRESILSFRHTSLFFVSARTNKRHQSIRGWEMEAKRRRILPRRTGFQWVVVDTCVDQELSPVAAVLLCDRHAMGMSPAGLIRVLRAPQTLQQVANNSSLKLAFKHHDVRKAFGRTICQHRPHVEKHARCQVSVARRLHKRKSCGLEIASSESPQEHRGLLYDQDVLRLPDPVHLDQLVVSEQAQMCPLARGSQELAPVR